MIKIFTKILLPVFLLIITNSQTAKATIVADFAYNIPASPPFVVQFINTSTSSNTIVSWLWNFGDGGQSTTVNPAHSYAPGTYLVKLVATSSMGEQDSVTKIVTIQTQQPVVTSSFASNAGKEFWFGYGHHQYMETTSNNTQNLVLYLSAGSQGGTVIVTIDSSSSFPATWFRKSYIIPANTTITTENLPKGTINAAASASNPNFDSRLFSDAPPIGTGSEGLFRQKGIHVESTVPITVQAHIYGGVSSAMTTLLPVNTWGYKYYSINSEQRDADKSYSWVYVIARENNTMIEITPSATTRLGKPLATPFTVLLQKGQIYQILSDISQTGFSGPNFTGTMVRSLIGPDGNYHPIAVFAGSSRTGGESSCGTGSGRDNDIQQLFPASSWGTEYLTAPVSKATNPTTLLPTQFQTSVYKVFVSDPLTVVKRNGVNMVPLTPSNHYIFTSNTADVITSDKPVFVAQFLSGTATCNGGLGDPDMVYLTPLVSGLKESLVYRTTREAIGVHYLTLIVPTAGLPSLRIDTSSVFSHTYPHPQKPGYSVVIKGWQATQAQTKIKCDSAFTAICYGLGAAESFAVNAGINIKTSQSTQKTLCATNGMIVLQSDITGGAYRWEVSKGDELFVPISDNANYTGSNTSYLQVSNLPDSMYGYIYRCVVDGSVSTGYKIAFKNEWNGSVNNDWENPFNWSCTKVPGYTTDVVIPSGATVVLSSNVTVHTLTVSPGATFTVTPGYTLTITN